MSATDQRFSPQREAVRAILGTARGFRGAQDLHAALRDEGQRISLATVYRHLQALADASEVDVLHTAEGESLYRRCSPEHHHHLICRNCGITVEVDAPPVEAWAVRAAADHGFTEVAHSVEVFGLCPRCAARRG